MNDTSFDNTTPNNTKKLFIILFSVFVVLGAVYALSLGPIESVKDAQAITHSENEQHEAAAEGQDIEDHSAEVSEVLFDMKLAKKERILGDSSAPIKIAEHSSLSCGHCGRFHRETFSAFKEAYIDTGRAYLVFSDFPLNAPALHGTMASRCVPEDRYFDFIGMLFEKQNDWAYEPNYINILQGYAQEYGLSEDVFNSCVQSKELQEHLIKRLEAVGKQFQVQSTPSFVINNQKTVTGALAFDAFDKTIQNALTEIKTDSVEGE